MALLFLQGGASMPPWLATVYAQMCGIHEYQLAALKRGVHYLQIDLVFQEACFSVLDNDALTLVDGTAHLQSAFADFDSANASMGSNENFAVDVLSVVFHLCWKVYRAGMVPSHDVGSSRLLDSLEAVPLLWLCVKLET